MGRGKTKLVLEEDEGDDDILAAEQFLKHDTSKSKKSKKVKVDEIQEKEDAEREGSTKGENPKIITEKYAHEKTPSDKKPQKKVKSSKDEGDDGKEEKYQRLILFVGQIPFEAKASDVEQHFFDHGAGKVKVRLLTEKGTNKSRGMAFVDFETPQQLVRGLRVHHTRLLGRAINVERTVGGGGNNAARKEKLSQLREFQGSKVKREVEELANDAIKNSHGNLTKEDVDDLVIRSLCVLPRDAAKQVLEEVLESDIANARNKKAWILGCIKRYTSRLKTGEQFLKLEEEKAGIVEKRKESRPTGNRERSTGASGRSGGPPSSRGSSRGVSSSSRGNSGNLRGPADGPPRNKFKRGMIGQS